jgi:hypothetical protein
MEEMNVTSGERNELMALQRSRTAAVARVRRARLILLLDEGQPWSAIKQELRCDSRFISTWGGRFVQARLGGLFARHSGPRADARSGPARGAGAQGGGSGGASSDLRRALSRNGSSVRLR